MTNKQPTYFAYLLRLWREERGGQSVWRASVEIPGSDKRLAFADLATFYAFLEAETTGSRPESTKDPA